MTPTQVITQEENKEKFMDTKECAKCGKNRLATSFNDDGVCLACEYDAVARSNTATGSNPDQIGQSSSRAIEVYDIVNNFIAWVGMVLIIVAIALGIGLESMATVGVGCVIALVTLVTWALNRMFIGIAQDIKAIRVKVESS